jgi:hypothetical protein
LSQENWRVSFSRKAFENLLQFDWQAYHTIAIAELEEMGWVIIRLRKGEADGYMLTEAGETNLWQARNYAMAGLVPLTFEQANIPF